MSLFICIAISMANEFMAGYMLSNGSKLWIANCLVGLACFAMTAYNAKRGVFDSAVNKTTLL